MKQHALFIKNAYNKLLATYGAQGWWPGETPFEVIIGAILTQNTAWTNVEKAIVNLKREGLLSSPERLLKIPRRRLTELIKPAGFYNIKAERIRNFLIFLKARYNLQVEKMALQDTEILRRELLDVNGIGPETCDSILLYACNKSVFVIDAYTKRIFSRHGIIKHTIDYDSAQKLFTSTLPRDRALYNEYHALIVRCAKEHCRTRPKCKGCPLAHTHIP